MCVCIPNHFIFSRRDVQVPNNGKITNHCIKCYMKMSVFITTLKALTYALLINLFPHLAFRWCDVYKVGLTINGSIALSAWLSACPWVRNWVERRNGKRVLPVQLQFVVELGQQVWHKMWWSLIPGNATALLSHSAPPLLPAWGWEVQRIEGLCTCA